MRTTVRLNEELLARLKQYAAQRNRTMTSVLEDAVRQLLDRQDAFEPKPTIDLVTYGHGGMVVEVDIEDQHTWRQVLDDEDIARFHEVTDAPA